MQTEAVGSSELAVVAGDVLALRGAGLAAPETWALLCQAAQALQDLFLSNGGVVGGSGVGPVVTPHTLELTPRGRVTLQLASPETARAYLPPEYRLGRVYSDTDSEKMWMYSLGRALLDTTPRITALTGSVSVSPSSALQSVLSAMTEPDPRRRASLMNLLDVISEYCRTRLQSKPFTHIVMDMYREVTRSPQYGARKRAAFPALRSVLPPTQRPHQRQNQHQAQSQQQIQQHQKKHQTQQHQHTGHFSKHQVKGALFKAQSRNSRSHPNLLSLSGHEPSLSSPKPQFQSQIDIQTRNMQHSGIHHARTSSQPEYSERVQQRLTGHTRSTHNLIMFSNGQSTAHNSQANNVYSDPIYALPVKPFLSSQDVRVNGLSAKPNTDRQDFYGQTVTGRPRTIKNGGSSQPNIAHLARAANGDRPSGHMDDVRDKVSVGRNSQTVTVRSLHRQYSNPQLPTRNLQESVAGLRTYSQSNGSTVPPRLRVFTGDNKVDGGRQNGTQNNLVSSTKVPSLHGPVPPKPPRVITTLKRSAAPLPESNNGLSESVAPAKPPRLTIKNGPRARRGKPVQRAPSRLYRAIGGPTRCFNKNQCVGPEFVVRANQPPKILCVGDTKASSSARIVVILLTGQRIEVSCDPQKITAGELFQAIVQAEGLDENFTLGLAALLAGDFAMLPPETKLNKVAPPGWLNSSKSKGTLGLPTSFMLYLRLRFFLPSLRGTRSWISKHLLYLQIRRCILEQQLVCPLAQLVNLTGFALQAEFGNYNVNEHGRGEYFLLEHYIPESLILNPDLQLQQFQLPGGAEALRAELHQAHRDRRGLDANNAEEMFVTHAQALPDYGSHYYIATADNKELEKIIARLKKSNANRPLASASDGGLYTCTENIYQLNATSDCPIYGKIELNRMNSCDNVQRTVYTDEPKIRVASTGSNACEDIYAVPTSASVVNLVEANNNSNKSNNNNKPNKSKKSECNVWLAIHAQGLKLFERGGRPRDRNELARLQWRDIQTLSYSKTSLVVYTRFNGKRCKFKLRMDHKKSYYAFKLTSLHHQFFLKLRSELTSLHGLAKDFGIPLMVEQVSPPVKLKPDPSKPKITIVNSGKNVTNPKYPMQLEEYQNKENENPQKVINPLQKSEDMEPVCYTPEEDALYAQVNARLEPEGASRDTEDESDRALVSRNGHAVEILKPQRTSEQEKLYNYPSHGLPCHKESLYSIPKPTASNDTDRLEGEVKHPEELYAAINKPGHNKKSSEYPVPDEVWDVANSKKCLNKVKTSSLPNYGTPRQSTGFRTPSLPRRLGVKMGTRAIYSSVVQRDSDLTDDLESLSIKSDTASSIQSASAQSNESPMPEAYVLNADIRTDDETFRIGNDDTMSASLVARLEELSFAEERILHTIQLERGHGGSIGLQVTEGNDGGVYVQAVSVGGSADMAGNVNKGDRIVAINGQSLLNLRYEEALKMLQSSSETVELVLSQITSNRHGNLRREQEPTESNYLHNLRFEISSEAETSSITTKWLSQRATDVASVQNTSSAYSSAASSSMGNHNTNNMYLTDVADTNAFNSASMLLSLSDFDVSLESDPPPVPPRRRKRKTDNLVSLKPIVATRTIAEELKTSARNAGCRPERKPRSLRPPPPLPQSVVPRGRKSRSAGNGVQPPAGTGNLLPGSVKPNSSEVISQSKSVIQEFSNTTTSPGVVPTKVTYVGRNPISAKINHEREPRDRRSKVNSDYRNENRSGRSSPMPERYSPLFFTRRDFESVMAHSGKSDKSLNQQFDSIVTRDKFVATSITSFIKNSTIDDDDEDEEDHDDDDEQVCFRVTTTNVPFEKCLGDWNVSYESGDFNSKFNENDDHYIFDDYMNCNKRLNGRPVGAIFPFNDVAFENFDKKEPTSLRSATKVRFVIESPNSSSSDPDINDTFESFSNSLITNDVKTIDNSHPTSVIITEITENHPKIEVNDGARKLSNSDEFGDVPFSSLIESEADINNDFDSRENCHPDTASALKQSEVVSNDEIEVAEEVVESVDSGNILRPRSTPSPRFNSPKKPDFESITNVDEDPMPELPLTYDPRDEGFIGKQSDVSDECDFLPETFSKDRSTHFQTSHGTPSTSEASKNAREAFLTRKLNVDSQGNQEMNCSIVDDSRNEEALTGKLRFTEQKIFIDSTLRDFIDNNDKNDMDWSDLSGEEDDTEKKTDTSKDAGPSNLNDRRVEESSVDNKLLNRDTCHSQEVSFDKHSRSPRSMTNDNNECSDEKSAIITTFSRSRYPGFTSSHSADSKDDVNWIASNFRRNSFLENMLTDQYTPRELETIIPCSIIAAHPKPSSPPRTPVSQLRQNIFDETIEKPPSPFADFSKRDEPSETGIVAGGSNEISRNQLGNEIGARVVGSKPRFLETGAFSMERPRRKSAGEAKSDVLSELLCNFSAIKLRMVPEPQKRESFGNEINDGATMVMNVEDEEARGPIKAVERIKIEDTLGVETIKGETRMKDVPVGTLDSSQNKESAMTKGKTSMETKIPERSSSLDIAGRVSEKTDDHYNRRRIDDRSAIVVIECMEDRGTTRRRENFVNTKILETCRGRTLDNRDTIVDVDKCAIDRYNDNSQIRRNNNDNNAITPVDVSNDQKSRAPDVSTIAPGSVRSFVELYEIQREQTRKYSKSNYSLSVDEVSMRRCSKGWWDTAEFDTTGVKEKEERNGAVTKFPKVTDDGETNASKVQALSQISVGRSSENERSKMKDASRDAIAGNNVVQNGDSAGRDEFLRTNGSINVYEGQSSERTPVAAKRRTQESCLKITNELSPREDPKKIVTFCNDSDVTKTADDARISLVDANIEDIDARPKIPKRRAPGIPAAGAEEIDELGCAMESIVKRDPAGLSPSDTSVHRQGEKVNPTPSPRSTVSSIPPQIHQAEIEGDEKGCTVKSGIASSAPKSDVPQFQQPYVFYCRV